MYPLRKPRGGSKRKYEGDGELKRRFELGVEGRRTSKCKWEERKAQRAQRPSPTAVISSGTHVSNSDSTALPGTPSHYNVPHHDLCVLPPPNIGFALPPFPPYAPDPSPRSYSSTSSNDAPHELEGPISDVGVSLRTTPPVESQGHASIPAFVYQMEQSKPATHSKRWTSFSTSMAGLSTETKAHQTSKRTYDTEIAGSDGYSHRSSSMTCFGEHSCRLTYPFHPKYHIAEYGSPDGPSTPSGCSMKRSDALQRKISTGTDTQHGGEKDGLIAGCCGRAQTTYLGESRIPDVNVEGGTLQAVKVIENHMTEQSDFKQAIGRNDRIENAQSIMPVIPGSKGLPIKECVKPPNLRDPGRKPHVPSKAAKGRDIDHSRNTSRNTNEAQVTGASGGLHVKYSNGDMRGNGGGGRDGDHGASGRNRSDAQSVDKTKKKKRWNQFLRRIMSRPFCGCIP